MLEAAVGIPFISVVGTPRVMGSSAGERLKANIHAAYQRLNGLIQRVHGDDTLRINRSRILECAHEPGLAMEIESMAESAEIPIEDLLLVHGHSDLLSYYHSKNAASSSTYLSIPAGRTKGGEPCMALIWQVDRALLPHLVIVHRIPAHGPASMALTVGGVHPVAGVSEAGICVAGNELRVEDGAIGSFTTHLLWTILGAPSFEDAVMRTEVGPRFGGRAISVVDANGQRLTCELTGVHRARLYERASAARVHTNHVLDRELADSGVAFEEASSAERLVKVAKLAAAATSVEPLDIAGWFGFTAQPGADPSTDSTKIHDPRLSVAMIIEPKSRIMHLGLGGRKHQLDSYKL